MKIRGENDNYIQINQEKSNEAIKNQKCLYKIFGNFLKSETIFKIIKIAQINGKKIKKSRSQNKIQKVINNGNDVDEFFQNLKMLKSIF